MKSTFTVPVTLAENVRVEVIVWVAELSVVGPWNETSSNTPKCFVIPVKMLYSPATQLTTSGDAPATEVPSIQKAPVKDVIPIAAITVAVETIFIEVGFLKRITFVA